MSSWHYAHCGLTVASEIPLPELRPLEGNSLEPDVRVQLAHAPTHVGRRAEFSVSPGEARLSVPQAGVFEVRDGRQIVARPSARVAQSQSILRAYLLGSAWGALLHQRGAFPLHAGVVANDGGALAFCGPPTAGKSSTVAWLVRRGAGLVSDDLTRLEVPVHGPPLIWPSTPSLKLSRETLATEGWPAPSAEAELPDEKFRIHWESPIAEGPLPLRAVYLLSWGEPGMRRLRGVDAVQRFLSGATYRHELLDVPGGRARYWQQCVEVVRRVPIWELSRLRDWSSMDQVMKQLSLGSSAGPR